MVMYGRESIQEIFQNHYDRHSLQHPFDLTHPGFDSLARNGDGGLELLGKEGDLVLLDHPDKLFQRQTLLPVRRI